ncbi:hypothetical protein [Mycobacterium palustre]|uniref:Uncharacterized protein n=1 Tax=Mycobacterium palustre TaxID=153971 RepID=A0A1X1ZLY5_9MYCO|nr:hypothetical protein [Mycobacterium palustre]ORW24366.1 hypothetical protein AWC19_09665 [Mycobacterium palustre]
MPSPAEQKPFKLRLPHIDNDELIRRVKEHSKITGWPEVMKTPSRYGENLFYGTVPEIYGADVEYWSVLMALVLGIDPKTPPAEVIKRGVPVDQPKSEQYKRYMLMSSWLHCVHMRNGWTRTIMGGWASEGAGITRTKLLLLDMPDADIWTDDERLALKFVKAAFEWEMTDELWDAAAEAWTPEWILAVLGLLVHYYGYSLRFSAIGLDRVVGLTADKSIGEVIGLVPPSGS